MPGGPEERCACHARPGGAEGRRLACRYRISCRPCCRESERKAIRMMEIRLTFRVVQRPIGFFPVSLFDDGRKAKVPRFIERKHRSAQIPRGRQHEEGLIAMVMRVDPGFDYPV